MIFGKVAENLDPCMDLTVCLPDGRREPFSAVIDTGFNSELAAPPTWLEKLGAVDAAPTEVRLADDTVLEVPCYSLTVLWHGQERRIRAIAAGEEVLIGMRLLRGSQVKIDVEKNGSIEIGPLH
jgi:clan AA aspartic protease